MELKCMRPLILASAILLSPMALFAQLDQEPLSPNQQSQPMQQQQHPAGHPTPEAFPHESNATPGFTGQEMKDKIFLRKSAEVGIAEVKMGQLAADKGSSDDVKSFGSKMVADRTQLSTEMKPIADSMGIRLPKDMNKEDKARYEQLASLSGEEFDKAYILTMLQDHRKDFREFHEELMGTNDPVLKAEIEKGEGVIRDHMHLAVKMAKDRNIMPARPTPPPASPVQ
jgi:putative membrane protein